MNIKVQIANAPHGDIRETPPELRETGKTVARVIASLLCLHGVKKVHGKPMQIGAVTVLDKRYSNLAIAPSELLMRINDEAMSLLIKYMSLFGITSIEINPTSEELQAISDSLTAESPVDVNNGDDDDSSAKHAGAPEDTPVP